MLAMMSLGDAALTEMPIERAIIDNIEQPATNPNNIQGVGASPVQQPEAPATEAPAPVEPAE